MRTLKTQLMLFCCMIFLFSYTNSQQKVEQWDRFEISFTHHHSGNGFEVRLTAIFKGKDTSVVVSGFYDGENSYKIRFMPQQIGEWTYTTSSSVAALNNRKGKFECIKATGKNHGMVNVSETYNFRYTDGTRYYPFGTTIYAWTHMADGLQELTLKSLSGAGFNKVRMCVFPKNYGLVKEEPELYSYAIQEVKKDATGKESKVWDFEQFNPRFYQHLEKRIDDLGRLGIEADLILFHPYDRGRWGFDTMPNDKNLKYIKYLTARLSSFRNIWWSMANEFDLVNTRPRGDWDLLSKAVVESDPYRHLCSIHGSTANYYEYWKPEFTHISIQDEAPVMNPGAAAILRHAYYKPIIYDEVGYEGNLQNRWGRYSPEEMTHLIWMGVIAGTYVTHGESYMFKDDKDTIFWAKGGEFKGTSWKRVAFLRSIVEACPNPLQMADVSRDNVTSTAGSGYYIIYFGKEMKEEWLFNLPIRNASRSFGYKRPEQGTRFKVEIIDTWEMTTKEYPQIFETTKEIDYRVYDKDFKKVRIPLKPYIALRITAISR